MNFKDEDHRRRRRRRALAIATAALLFAVSLPALAAEGGYSNYVPGTYGDFAMSVEPETGLTFRNDIYHYTADSRRSVRSGLLEAEADLDFLINFTTVIHKPKARFLGGQYAFGAFIPIARIDIDTSITIGNTPLEASDDTTGLGDIVLIPLLVFWNRGNVHMSLGQYIVTPTGDYDVDNLVNTGLNYYSFDTNFGFTHLDMESGRELSFNLGHIYNTENDDTDYQTGRELHLDATFNRFFSESFALGVHGFYLKQITGDSGDGALLGDFKAEAAGIGPALLWTPSAGKRPVTLIAKWLHEFHAENRLEGDHFMFSVAFGF